jgi:hypothetical protein
VDGASGVNISLVLKQHQVRVDLERQVHRIAIETSTDVPAHPKAQLPGDPWRLRGIPVVGVHGGIGGAMLGTRP